MSIIYIVVKFTPIKEFEPNYFSKRELRLLEHVAERTKNKSGKQLIKILHKEGLPWDVTVKSVGLGAEVDNYLYVKNEEDEALFKERNYEREQIEEYFNAP